MNLFNLKTNFWKVALIGLLFVIPVAKVSATEWDGNIFFSNISSSATNEAPDFIVSGSDQNSASRKFQVVVMVTTPAVDENKDGKIDDTSEELKSWNAVEDSGITTIDGVPHLTSLYYHLCPGGFCFQISTDNKFKKENSLWYKLTPGPGVLKKSQIQSIVVKGFKPGIKYYYRFVGQESWSDDEHYIPTNEYISFTPTGVAAIPFSIEIPKEKITKTLAELIVHMPAKDNIDVKLYKGNTQLNPPLDRKGINAASEPATGGYFHRLTTSEITLEPGTQYKVVVTTFGGSKTEAFFTTLADPASVSENPKPEPSIKNTGEYRLLAPLPVFGEIFNVEKGLGPYLQVIFTLLIGIAGLLSVIMIVIGGIEYMSTDAMSGKEEGRERVTQAILGLIIALGSWVLLNTINPDLLSLRFKLGEQTVTQTGGVSGTGGAGTGVNASYEAIKGTCKHTSPITISHFSMGVVWTSTDATANENLKKLQAEFNKLNNLTKGQLTPNSVYRTPLYQQHLYEIHGLYNELKNNNTTECKALKSWVIDEHNRQHGIGSTVAKPTSSAPHTRGIGIDIGINPGSSYTYTSLDKLAQDNIIHLRWKKIPGDDAHFELTN